VRAVALAILQTQGPKLAVTSPGAHGSQILIWAQRLYIMGVQPWTDEVQFINYTNLGSWIFDLGSFI
jgi:hypothetical protein